MGKGKFSNGRISSQAHVRVDQLESRRLMSAAVIYVDAAIASQSSSKVHNGTSWANAYPDLQSALTEAAAAGVPEQIWIAQGTYIPTQVYSPLNAESVPVVGGYANLKSSNLKTFNLPNNVALYGGFSYGMTALSSANPQLHPTTLSGDLAGNDSNSANPTSTTADKSDNAWHVVTLGDDVTDTGVTASLTGLSIIDGYANGTDVGGTLSPFIDGNADGGGILSDFHSNLTVNDCSFKYDFAASDGGGLFSDGSNLVAENSSFEDNESLVRAGGLEGLNDFENGVSHTSLVENDYFYNNTCATFGGALVGEGAAQGVNSEMTIQGSTFIDNHAPEGGAMVFDTETVHINDCTYTDNVASVDGGAISTTNIVGTITGQQNDFQTTVTNSVFTGNVSMGNKQIHDTFFPFAGISFSRGGGAITTYMNGFLNVSDSIFIANTTSQGDGGAILNGDASYNSGGTLTAYAVHDTITDSVFLDNSAANGNGGAIASEIDHLLPMTAVASTSLVLTNSSFGGNSASGDGGAIFLDTSAGTFSGDIFLLDSASNGRGLFATASTTNGLSSTASAAIMALRNENTFLLDNIVLV